MATDTTHQASCDVTRGGACSCPAGDPRRQGSSRCIHGRTVQSRRDNPCPPGHPGCRTVDHLLMVGTTWDGTEVLVRVWLEDPVLADWAHSRGRKGVTGQVEVRDPASRRWGLPGRLEEEAHG